MIEFESDGLLFLALGVATLAAAVLPRLLGRSCSAQYSARPIPCSPRRPRVPVHARRDRDQRRSGISLEGWLAEWVLVDVLWRIGIGVLAGLGVGSRGSWVS